MLPSEPVAPLRAAGVDAGRFTAVLGAFAAHLGSDAYATLAELEAPADGMFFGLRALPNVQTGDWCCFFCKVEGTRD